MAVEMDFHPQPAWSDRGNVEITVFLDFTPDPSTHRLERLWCRKLSEYRLELCCIPFLAYNLALGDEMIVAPSDNGHYDIIGVALRSGHFTFRVWSPDASSKDLRLLLDVVRTTGSLVEPHPTGCGFAIDVDSASQRDLVLSILEAHQDPGHIEFEKSDGITDKNIKVHFKPARRELFNGFVLVPVRHDGAEEIFEQLYIRRLDTGAVEICCIPFFVNDVALGDLVDFRVSPEGKRQVRLVQSSGNETYWIWLNDSTPREICPGLDKKLLDAGLEFEWFGGRLVAVNLPADRSPGLFDEVLSEYAGQRWLEYTSSKSDRNWER